LAALKSLLMGGFAFFAHDCFCFSRQRNMLMLSGKLRKRGVRQVSRVDDLSPEHISWLVESRSRNQQASLKLYLVSKDHAQKITDDWDLSNIAQSLAGICFSLWRAVFLSDIDANMAATGSDAQSFLGNLILHNMVAYPQDRNTRDWTFVYYVNNAMYRLEAISKAHLDILPASFVTGVDAETTAKDFWTYYQTALEISVRNFELALKKPKNSN
jgi:hypothetical protein